MMSSARICSLMRSFVAVKAAKNARTRRRGIALLRPSRACGRARPRPCVARAPRSRPHRVSSAHRRARAKWVARARASRLQNDARPPRWRAPRVRALARGGVGMHCAASLEAELGRHVGLGRAFRAASCASRAGAIGGRRGDPRSGTRDERGEGALDDGNACHEPRQSVQKPSEDSSTACRKSRTRCPACSTAVAQRTTCGLNLTIRTKSACLFRTCHWCSTTRRTKQMTCPDHQIRVLSTFSSRNCSIWYVHAEAAHRACGSEGRLALSATSRRARARRDREARAE